MATSPTLGGGRGSGRGANRGRRGSQIMESLSAGDQSFGSKRLKGRYEIGMVLGHGSLGTTYRAHDRLLERPVAVKVLADRYADDVVFRERFMAATAAAGRLIHPNVVTVLDAGVVDGRPFVVMELVEGPSLRARLESWAAADRGLPADRDPANRRSRGGAPPADHPRRHSTRERPDRRARQRQALRLRLRPRGRHDGRDAARDGPAGRVQFRRSMPSGATPTSGWTSTAWPSCSTRR